MMKYGFVMPPNAAFEIAQFATEAEDAGWDGIFLAHGMWATDTFICLTVAAMHTERLHLGTMLTPISCIRPWKLATEVATLDNFSKGRVILTIGMGAPDTGFANYGEVTDLRTRAELVDEGLDIMTNLWSGEPFTHHEKHYTVTLTDSNDFRVPLPMQQPRPPVWVVGAWPRPKSMRRAVRCDGLVPVGADTPNKVREAKAWVDERRTATTPYDVVIEGMTSGDPAKAREHTQPWADAGATWWIESMWGLPAEHWWRRLRQGPPAK